VRDSSLISAIQKKPRCGSRSGVLVFALQTSELATHSAPAPAAGYRQQQSYGQQGTHKTRERIMALPGLNSLWF